MSNIRKLSAFRQLSLNCSPTPEQRRKTLKKQFSEDIPDYKDKWIDPGIGIKISLNTKSNRNLDRPPPIRIAWEENAPELLKAEEAVIIKKCKEIRRSSTGKLSKQNSLERNSILHSKQELTEKLKLNNVKEKEQEKTNLKIFLAHNSKEQVDEIYNNHSCRDASEKSCERPKINQPLITNNVSSNSRNLFQIRRNFRPKINLAEIAYSPTRSSEIDASIHRNDTVVVVPIVEREQGISKQDGTEQSYNSNALKKDDIKPIDSIIIRPVTAASKREKFQKRTNSAFNATVKESPHSRPPLIRSFSAPIKSERGRQKFSATKRKLKTIKRVQLKNQLGAGDEEDYNASNKENPKSQKELNRATATNGSEIITMVSLVSPEGSDGEEESLYETKEKCKSKTNSTNNIKSNSLKEDIKEPPKNMSLRKIVKSVSFQQSSIHAIRSFSASFPARRGSMATALMLGNNTKISSHGVKVQEKRSTNSNTPDDDERVPKRRLLRSHTREEGNIVSCEESKSVVQNKFIDVEEKLADKPDFAVSITTKAAEESQDLTEPDINEKQIDTSSETISDIEKKDDTKYESQKEKQCWEMYCKMTEKGINVSFDTILRGMLTPTEYRMSRKNIIVDTPEEPNPC